ncbi:hypothetical protein [Azohydromonas lata]|uniref:hypothetical protein n=1 Tax=Azohydromonas lata TaxID=45677 RepID=UPI00083051C6|nr:hypothetical protein [Azohydromonas lata]
MRTEILTWHKPEEGAFPDAEIDVLLHTDCEDCPVWPGYWDGEQWHGADGMPLRWRVIEWCDMPVGTVEAKAEACAA